MTKKISKKMSKKAAKKTIAKQIKKSSAKPAKKIVAVSGGFDPVHIGHLRMFEEAKKLGNYLVVILNNDNWLKKKKGYTFMPEHERMEILSGFRSVDEVVLSSHPENPTDMSVCADLRAVRPHVFANGGDRVLTNIPEVPVCEEIGAEMVFSIGQGGKVQSSSWLVDKLAKAKEKQEK